MTTCVSCWQAHKIKQQQDQRRNHHGPLEGCEKQQGSMRKPGIPPARIPEITKSSLHGMTLHPDTLKQTPTMPGHNKVQPTNPDPVQNKQPPAPNASNQNNQSTQTGVKKFSNPKRTPTRHSAAKDFCVWRQACFIMAPKNRIQKTSRNMAAIKRPRL